MRIKQWYRAEAEYYPYHKVTISDKSPLAELDIAEGERHVDGMNRSWYWKWEETEVPEVDEKKLLSTNDARVWADEFCKHFHVIRVAQSDGGPTPETVDDPVGLMLGWFANAMTAQEMNRPKPVAGDTIEDQTDPIDIHRAVYESLGAASTCWSETPKGEFDSTRAATVGEVLMDMISRYYHGLSKHGIEKQEWAEDEPIDEKYIVFPLPWFQRWWNQPEVGGTARTVPAPMPITDGVVIRRQDVFAPPALDVYANGIMAAVEMLLSVPELPLPAEMTDRVDSLRKIADYFHEQAAAAWQTNRKVPD